MWHDSAVKIKARLISITARGSCPPTRLFANEIVVYFGADDMPDLELSLNRKIPRAVAGL